MRPGGARTSQLLFHVTKHRARARCGAMPSWMSLRALRTSSSVKRRVLSSSEPGLLSETDLGPGSACGSPASPSSPLYRGWDAESHLLCVALRLPCCPYYALLTE